MRHDATNARRGLLLPQLILGALGLIIGARGSLSGQSTLPADTIFGRVIDSDSTPIPSARVLAVDEGRGVFRTRTDAQGRYWLSAPHGGGTLVFTIQALGYVVLTAEVERDSSTYRTERSFRLSPRLIVLDTVRAVRRTLDGPRQPTPGETAETLTSLTTEMVPVDPSDLAAVASITPGVTRTAGGDDGLALSFAGQAPGQNRTTVDGATYSGSQLPAEGIRSVSVLTSVFDVADGQFAGGTVIARTLSGTNLWGGAASVRLDEPRLRYGLGNSSGFSQSGRAVVLNAGGGGALVRNRLFIFGSGDLGRTSSSPTAFDPSGKTLHDLGVSNDTAQRFMQIVDSLGLGEPTLSSASQHGSALGRLDYVLSSRNTLTARVDWRATETSGAAASTLRILTGSSTLHSSSSGQLAQLASTAGAWHNEFRIYRSGSNRHTNDTSLLPAGEVRVATSLADGAQASALLGFGPEPSASPGEARTLLEVANDVSRESGDGRVEFRFGGLFQHEALKTVERQNLRGTFLFAGLGDLELERPALFTRSLGSPAGTGSRSAFALYAGSTLKPNSRVGVTYGLRLEGSVWGALPPVTADVAAWAGTRRVPRDLFIMPRVGVSYKLRDGGTTLRGGIGAYRGVIPLRLVSAASTQTGASTAEAQLVCVGSSAPSPDWPGYAAGTTPIPASCLGAPSTFAGRLSSISLFSSSLAAPRTWKMFLGVDGNLAREISYQANALLVRGDHLASARDLNFDPTVHFRLTNEGGRPVYVFPAEIDPVSGIAAPSGSRIAPGVGLVREFASAGESWTGQLSGGVTGIIGKRTLVNLNYTYGLGRDRAGGVPVPGAPVASTAGDPSRLDWSASDYDRRHSLTLIASHGLRSNVQVSLLAQVASGFPYTPIISGDLNGDGLANDRAFVFAPTATDPGVGKAMQRLFSTAPGPARECLRRQVGRVAGRNSCRTPWSTLLNLEARFTPRRFTESRRLMVTAAASNVTAGLDYLLHGGSDLRGWGQFPVADATLLELRGFEPAQGAYRYAVNPNFGRPPGNSFFRLPMQLVIQGRVTLGADPRTQPLARFVSSMLQARGGPAEVRRIVASRVRNIPATVIALQETDPEAMQLSSLQLRRLRAASDSLGPSVNAAVDRLVAAFRDPGSSSAARQARLLDAARFAQNVIERGIHAVSDILLPEQRRKLPAWLINPADLEELSKPPTVRFDIPGN